MSICAAACTAYHVKTRMTLPSRSIDTSVEHAFDDDDDGYGYDNNVTDNGRDSASTRSNERTPCFSNLRSI